MKAQEISIFPGKSDQQLLELVDPREISLHREPMLVHVPVEVAFPSPLDPFPIANVLRNIRSHAPVPEHFPCVVTVKATIRIEERTFIVQSQATQVLKQTSQRFFEVVTVIMFACQQPDQPDYMPLAVTDRQNIAGLGFLPPLIGDTFAPFFAIV